MKNTRKLEIILLTLFSIVLLLTVTVLAANGNDEDDEIDYNKPETITVENFQTVDASLLDSDKLERTSLSAEEIRDKVSTGQADTYRTKNQPIQNPTAKELAMLSKCSNFNKVDVDSLTGATDLTITDNSISSDSWNLNLPPYSEIPITRNPDGSIQVGDDISISQGEVIIYSDGFINVGLDSAFKIIDSDFRATEPMDIYNLNKAQPNEDAENTISYGDHFIRINVADDNNMEIKKGSDSQFTTLYVEPITDDSSVRLTENHIDGSSSIVQFTSSGTIFQNRENLKITIIDQLPQGFGEHNQIVIRGNSYQCSECTLLGSSEIPENIYLEISAQTGIREYSLEEIQTSENYNVAVYTTEHGDKLYTIQYSTFGTDGNVISTKTETFNIMDYDKVRDDLIYYYQAVDMMKQAKNVFTVLPDGSVGNPRTYYSDIVSESLSDFDETVAKSHNPLQSQVGKQEYSIYLQKLEESRNIPVSSIDTTRETIQPSSTTPLPGTAGTSVPTDAAGSITNFRSGYGKKSPKEGDIGEDSNGEMVRYDSENINDKGKKGAWVYL